MKNQKFWPFLLLFLFITTPLVARKPVVLLKELERATSPQKKAELSNLISEYYREVDPKEAICYGQKAASIALQSKDLHQVANAYNNISIGYYWLNKLSKASEYTYQALKIRQQLKDSVGIAASFNIIGNIYREQKEYAKALYYFRQALHMGQLLKRQASVAVSLNNIGTVHELNNQPQKALTYYLQVREINKVIGDKEDHAQDFLNIGNIYFLLGKKKEALPYLEEALRLSVELRNEVNKIYLYRILANLYLQDKQFGKAQNYAFESLQAAQELPSPVGIKEGALLLNNVYLAQGNYQKAHEYLTLSAAYADSLHTQQKTLAQAEIHAKYELTQKEQENRQLRIERELHQEKMFRKSILQYATAVLVVLFAALAYVAYRSKRRAKLANAKLSEYNQLILEKNTSIEVQKEELERLNQLKDKLFSIIAHDLRSPLISLRSLLQILSFGTLPPEKLERFVRDLDAQQQNTLGLLDNLLLWAKVQMQGLHLSPKPLQLRQVIENNIQLLRPQAEKKGVFLVNLVEEDAWVLADLEMLKLVFRNLMTNAIKFCHAQDQVTITAGLLNTSQLVITVQDNGVGISPENQLKLFGPNHFKETGTAHEKGSGLGLMLCKEFILKSGGDIWADSEMGVGSQFHFTLPVAHPAPKAEKEVFEGETATA